MLINTKCVQSVVHSSFSILIHLFILIFPLLSIPMIWPLWTPHASPHYSIFFGLHTLISPSLTFFSIYIFFTYWELGLKSVRIAFSLLCSLITFVYTSSLLLIVLFFFFLFSEFLAVVKNSSWIHSHLLPQA